MNVHVTDEQLAELRFAVTARRTEVEKIRAKMESMGLSTFEADDKIETLDGLKVALGESSADLFRNSNESPSAD